MAFADALRPSTAGTVVLRADTGQFNAEIEAAERRWRESVGQMSREALKLDLAQDRLRKSLAQYGAESAQAKRATIALRDAEEAAARAADRQTREVRELDRATRSASSVYAGLRNRVLGLAAAYIGTQGLVSVVRSSVEAAKEEQLVLGQTRLAVQAAGIEWDRYAERIAQVIRAQSQLGFDDEALMRTFALFVRSTRSVEEALRLNALAADVARGRYIDLEQAAQIVNKANLGMSGALRRIGIDVDRNATRTELLTALTRNFGRAAEEAADSAVAASDRLAVEWENMREVLGRGLLPAVTDLSNRLADYLGDAENQRRVQRQVNEAVETGEQVVRGLAAGIRVAKEAVAPLVDALGGLENAVQLALIVGFVRKAGLAALAMRGIRAASALAARGVAADALVMSRALDGVTASATRAAGAVGAVGAAGAAGAAGAGRGRILSFLFGAAAGRVLLSNPALLTIGAVLMSGGGGTQRGDRSRQYPLVYAAFQRAVAGEASPEEIAILQEELGRYSLANAPDERMRRAEQRLAGLRTRGGAPDTFDPRRPGTLARPPARAGAEAGQPGAGAPGSPTRSDLELALARAQTTRSRADDVAALRALRAFYARQIDQLEALKARKRLSEAQKEELRALYGDLANVQSQLDAIAEEGERKLEEQRRLAEERERRRMERIREAAARAAERRRQLLEDVPGTRRQLRRAALRGVDETLRRLRGEAGEARGLTEADFRRLSFELLGELRGVLAQFGSNIAGQTETNTWTTAQLTREQNRLLSLLVKGSWHPAARYAQAELGAAGWGVGF
jgi:hypothetical protein